MYHLTGYPGRVLSSGHVFPSLHLHVNLAFTAKDALRNPFAVCFFSPHASLSCQVLGLSLCFITPYVFNETLCLVDQGGNGGFPVFRELVASTLLYLVRVACSEPNQ